MKRWWLACAVVVLVPAGLWAQKAGDLGAGIMLGSPTGGTVKYFLSETRAVDLGVGVSEDAVFFADYLWHAWDILPPPKQGRFAGYLGLGGRIETESDTQFGIRTLAGLGYWVSGHPIEVFAELGPVFELTSDTTVEVDGALGLRYYFGSSGRKP